MSTTRAGSSRHTSRRAGLERERSSGTGDEESGCSCFDGKRPSRLPRHVRPNLLHASRGPSPFLDNVVSTKKYSLLTFLPKNLLEQFRRVANIYFLIVSFLTTLPTSGKNPVSLVGTFMLVLSVTAVKEAFEDYARYKSDEQVNRRRARVLRPGSADFVDVKWRDVVVGDIVRVEKNEPLPADMYLLASSDERHGSAYIETKNLDGESNLKTRTALTGTKSLRTVEELLALKCVVNCEPPNADVYTFNGSLRLPGVDPVPLNPGQILLRGCQLRNTDWLFGLVLYTGHETKIMMNSNNTPSKMSRVMRVMNRCLFVVFGLQLLMCLVNTIAALSWRHTVATTATYMHGVLESEGQLGLGSSDGVFGLEAYLTFIVAYSHLIPISLYVGLEILKLIQKYLIDNDAGMYDAVSDSPAQARTSNLVEELGQVSFIFSDKTGTLTSNHMEFVKASVVGRVIDSETDHLPPSPWALDGQPFTGGAAWRAMLEGDDSVESGELVENPHREFWKLLALCHTVVAEHPNKDDPREVIYQASSPDEAALVQAARGMGYFFVDRTPESMTLLVGDADGKKEESVTIELLNVLEFDSVRKRMSVIVREDGRLRLYCKGADSAILPRLDESCKGGRLHEQTAEDLREFSEDGLRTLVLASKDVDEVRYEEWSKRWHTASISIRRRRRKLAKLADEMEDNLVLLGATAIEDKLQDGVPEAIKSLTTAGIRVWVLTGDKEETAVNIGHSVQLLHRRMTIHRLSVNDTPEALAAHLDGVLATHDDSAGTVAGFSSGGGGGGGGAGATSSGGTASISRKRSGSIGAAEMVRSGSGGGGADEGIVIDGPTLQMALLPGLRDRFLRLALICKVCICCRSTPKQKAEVVKLVRDNLPVITLAIGDGANDVSMIQEAHLGIGITGEEGMQAVRSSDYAISQFRFLARLVLVHGKWSYKRVTKFVLYYFYKNTVSALTEFWFAWYCGFSGQIFFADYLSLGFNAIFTSYACVVILGIDQDTSARAVRRFPQLYADGPSGRLFNWKVFGLWTLDAVYHAIVCFFFTIAALSTPLPSGVVMGHWWAGTASFTYVILVVTAKIALETRSWNKWARRIIVLSILVYVVSIFVLCSRPIGSIFQPELVGMINGLIVDPAFWFTAILTVVASLLPDFLAKVLQVMFYPTATDIVREADCGYAVEGWLPGWKAVEVADEKLRGKRGSLTAMLQRVVSTHR
eukprot:PLAT15173.1.p1 GENE.PLAT15173.1~~PLAT15173.1.p1  ORF type:complete len:1229 (+),score=655.01 PLAT15173.1:52-3687(+)